MAPHFQIELASLTAMARALAQAQHLAAKLLALKNGTAKPSMARYSVFIRTPKGYVHASTIEASALPCACQQFMRAWFSRTTTCTVVMRAPCGKRYSYDDSRRVMEGAHV